MVCPPLHTGSLQPIVTQLLPTREMTGRVGRGGTAVGVGVRMCRCEGVMEVWEVYACEEVCEYERKM